MFEWRGVATTGALSGVGTSSSASAPFASFAFLSDAILAKGPGDALDRLLDWLTGFAADPACGGCASFAAGCSAAGLSAEPLRGVGSFAGLAEPADLLREEAIGFSTSESSQSTLRMRTHWRVGVRPSVKTAGTQ
eukprot:scaffold323383_cov31-Tisochrysis_lutea.AAC.3